MHLQPEFERNRLAWTTAAVVLLSILVVFIWFLFLSRLPWRTRPSAFVTSASPVATGLTVAVRVEKRQSRPTLP